MVGRARLCDLAWLEGQHIQYLLVDEVSQQDTDCLGETFVYRASMNRWLVLARQTP